MKALWVGVGVGLAALTMVSGAPATAEVWVEAEGFGDRGGWEVDTQFIDQMGSPYLLAHGLGEPVADARTTVRFPHPGSYRVWVRTKDWVARWHAPGTPGRFQLVIDGAPVPETFGTRGADWSWQDGGAVQIERTDVSLALRDLTGFDGRCDALYFTSDLAAVPPNGVGETATWRRRLSGQSAEPTDAGNYDLVVVGGGYAGIAAAVSAARMGCQVALVQDRPVLGGNGSSEIRVWAQGLICRGLFPRLGEIVREFMDSAKKSPGTSEEFEDAKKEALVRAEKNIRLFLNHHVMLVETQDNRIVAVVALETRTNERRRFRATLFSDCTGHGSVGVMAGARHTVRRTGHMGMSNMWRWRMTDREQSFPDTPWALALGTNDFPYPRQYAAEWFWESGFDEHPIDDLEAIRDGNFRAVFGAFSALKNGQGKAAHANAKLEWVAFVGGNRESRQLLGDVVLTREDIAGRRAFPDGCVPTTWDIDLHYPDDKYRPPAPTPPFISRAVFDKAVDRTNGYPVPYRCFYSTNVANLFMAGRCISVTHEALGTVRVMKTGGMTGEVVGKAAALCVQHRCSPRDVYERHWDELKALMNLPGAARRPALDAPVQIP